MTPVREKITKLKRLATDRAATPAERKLARQRARELNERIKVSNNPAAWLGLNYGYGMDAIERKYPSPWLDDVTRRKIREKQINLDLHDQPIEMMNGRLRLTKHALTELAQFLQIYHLSEEAERKIWSAAYAEHLKQLRARRKKKKDREARGPLEALGLPSDATSEQINQRFDELWKSNYSARHNHYAEGSAEAIEAFKDVEWAMKKLREAGRV